jgi:hypothetical protein
LIGPPFHAGLIVADVESAMKELGAAFALDWSSVRVSETVVWTPGGRVDLTFRGGFSKPGPTRLELIEAIPGTLWDTTRAVALHHVSFWSSALEEDSDELAQKGFPLVATAWQEGAEGRPCLFAYHRKDSGPFMELLDERERPQYEEWWEEKAPDGSPRLESNITIRTSSE